LIVLKITAITDDMRNIIHLLRIAITLARHDALFPLDLIKSPFITFVARLARRERKGVSKGQRLAAAFIELGPTFVKLGQALSVRSDLIGEDIAADLAVLQDKLPPFSAAKAREIIEEEFGAKLEDIFAEFSPEAIAAASIAQVHRAQLKTGEDVAVKILRPEITAQIARDIELFYWIARLIEKRNRYYAKRLKPVEVIKTFDDIIHGELDMRLEAAGASKLRENFVGFEGFYVPQIYWKYTTQKVFVLEWIDGIKIDDKAAIVKAGHSPDVILANSSRALFKQVFDDGFFHADIHPGNVFVNARGEIVPIDFGIMGRIDANSRMFVAQIMSGFLRRDYDKVADAHFDAGYVPAHKSREQFALACRAVGEPVMDLPINEISVARLLAQMFKVAEDFEMEAQPHLLLMQKTMMMSEGVGRSLNPNLNMWKLAEPLVIEWATKNLGLQAQAFDALKNAKDILEKIPEIIRKLDLYLDRKIN
jgi:ubiquinone biosynthesis protein